MAAAAPQKLETPGVKGDVRRPQQIHLLPDGAVNAGVSGVEANGAFPVPLRRLKGLEHLLQGHFCAVIDPAVLPAQPQQHRIHQTARINHHIRLFQQFRSPQSDEIRRTGSRAHKMYHGCASLSFSHWACMGSA